MGKEDWVSLFLGNWVWTAGIEGLYVLLLISVKWIILERITPLSLCVEFFLSLFFEPLPHFSFSFDSSWFWFSCFDFWVVLFLNLVFWFYEGLNFDHVFSIILFLLTTSRWTVSSTAGSVTGPRMKCILVHKSWAEVV